MTASGFDISEITMEKYRPLLGAGCQADSGSVRGIARCWGLGRLRTYCTYRTYRKDFRSCSASAPPSPSANEAGPSMPPPGHQRRMPSRLGDGTRWTAGFGAGACAFPWSELHPAPQHPARPFLGQLQPLFFCISHDMTLSRPRKYRE